MATQEAEAHLRRLHSLSRRNMPTDRASSNDHPVRHHYQRPLRPTTRASNRSQASSKRHQQRRGRQLKQAKKHRPPQMPRPKYIEVKDSSVTSSVSIVPPRDLSHDNIKKYRDYIQELSNRLGDDYVYAEEMDIEDLMPQKPQHRPHEDQSHNKSQSHHKSPVRGGSCYHIGKVKDSMIEQHYHQSTTGEFDSDSVESSYTDEEMDQQSSQNNFLIPSNANLNPRANLYLLTLVTYIIVISSSVVGNGKSTPRSSSERAALFFSSTSLLVSIATTVSFRYAPLRIYITRPFSFYEMYLGQVIDSREKLSSLVLLISTFIVCGIVMQPETNLAVSSNLKVLNSSLFYSTWVSVYTSAIIIADLFTLDKSHMIIARNCDYDYGVVPSGYQLSFQRSAMRAWFVSSLSNVALSAILFSARSSGLRWEDYHTKVMVAGFLSLCGGVIGTGMLTLNHIITSAQDRACSYGTWNSSLESPTAENHLINLGFYGAMIVLLLSCVNVGLTNSGPSIIVFPSWVAFVVAALLCKLYVDKTLKAEPQPSCLAIQPQPQYKERTSGMCSDSDRSKGTGTTAYESNSIESCDDDSDMSIFETGSGKRRLHDELMDRLKTSPTNVAGQREPEEEIYTPKCDAAAPTTALPRQEPEEDSGLPDESHNVNPNTSSQTSKGVSVPETLSASGKTISPLTTCLVINEKLKRDVPSYRPSKRNSQKDPPSSRYPPPPPPPPIFKESKSSEGGRTKESIGSVNKTKKARRRSKHSKDGFVRLSGKNPGSVDALVADALRHARLARETTEDQLSDSERSDVQDILRKHRQYCRRRSSGVMSDSDESSEQRRARKVELADLLDKVDSQLRHSPKEFSHASTSTKLDKAPQTPTKKHRTKSERRRSSNKSTSTRSDPFKFD